jgi:hypothetical protein
MSGRDQAAIRFSSTFSPRTGWCPAECCYDGDEAHLAGGENVQTDDRNTGMKALRCRSVKAPACDRTPWA